MFYGTRPDGEVKMWETWEQALTFAYGEWYQEVKQFFKLYDANKIQVEPFPTATTYNNNFDATQIYYIVFNAIVDSWEQEPKLIGRYDAENGELTVSYESTWVPGDVGLT